MRRLRELGDAGVRVSVRWVRAHRGILGNEVADSFAKAARRKRECYPRLKPIAYNLATSRLKSSADYRARSDIRRDASTSDSSRAYLFGTRLEPNPLLEDAGALPATRRDEAIFHQLCTGCPVFSSGFAARDRAREDPVCPSCGDSDSAEHFLLDCPGNAEQRAKLAASAKQAFEEEQDQRAARAETLGRDPPRRGAWRGLNRSVLSQHPAGVLTFIQEQTVWYDRIAKREGCRGV